MTNNKWLGLLLAIPICACVAEISGDDLTDEAALRATMAARDLNLASGPLVFGEVTIDHDWKRVTFVHPIKDPVVVAKPFSSNGHNPGVLRMRNLDSSGFELRIQEWSYLDGWHYAERVGYLAAERGAHALQGSTNVGDQLVAGSFDSSSSEFSRVKFSQPFGSRPAVLTSIATFAGSDAVTGRLDRVDTAGFDFKLQEQESSDQSHPKTERVNYIALLPGGQQLGAYRLDVRTAEIDHRFKQVRLCASGSQFSSPPVFVAEMQTTNGGNPANVRWRNKSASDVELRVSEEQSQDTELDHNPETVGVVAIGTWGGGAADFQAVAPFYVQAGQPFSLRLVRVDRARGYVRDTAYRGTVAVSATDSSAKLPSNHTFTAADAGYRALSVTLETPGLHHLTITETATGNRRRSNIVKVTSSKPAQQIYFGDIHSHTPISDGRTFNVDQHYRYARDVALLDIAAVTDHDTLLSCCATTAAEWAHLQQRTSAYHAPGRFVTIHAYEWTDGNAGQIGSGHKNVYFAREAGAEIYSHDDPAYDDALDLWSALEASWSPGEVLTIPHHPARIYKGHDRSSTDWSLHDPRFQRLVEIYSAHGLFERCSSDAFQPPEGKAAGRCVRDALGSYGYRLGFVAAADHHRHPLGYLGPMDGSDSFGGLRFSGGLTAVVAKALTRPAIFSAMFARKTYATSGERILLEFSVDGHSMGSQVSVSLPHAPVIAVTAGGTQPIDRIEIIKYDTSSQRWSVLHARQPDRLTDSFTFKDTNFGGSALYYARVQQRTGALHGEKEMAWSSPVWVDPK